MYYRHMYFSGNYQWEYERGGGSFLIGGYNEIIVAGPSLERENMTCYCWKWRRQNCEEIEPRTRRIRREEEEKGRRIRMIENYE